MIRESVVENTIISFLQDQGYELFDANDDWFLSRRLDEFINKELFLSCLDKINKYNDEGLYEDVYNKITRLESPSLFERNFAFHRMLVDGITELKSFDEDATTASLDDAYIQPGANSENSQYRYDIPTFFNSTTSVSYEI